MNPLRAAAQQVTPPVQAYSGAQFSRLTKSWSAHLVSPDRDIRFALRTLRARSRQLAQDSPHVVGYLNLLKSNVIGPNGIGMESNYTRPGLVDDDPAAEALQDQDNDAIEDAWEDFCLPENCSCDGRMSWVDIQNLCLVGQVVDGEVLLYRERFADTPSGYALRFLDPDQLDENFNRFAGDQGNEIRMGVEIDAQGKPVAYHLWDHHPADLSGIKQRITVPASDIIHLFDQERPNQTRGVPKLASVMLRLRMLDKYEEAELMAAHVAAAKMGFFITKTDEFDPPTEGKDGSTPDKLVVDAEPASLMQLPPGVEFQEWAPTHPTSAFAQFEQAILRAIAAGLGVSYASLASDLTGANYSSLKTGLVGERDLYRWYQRRLTTRLHRVVFQDFLASASLRRAVALPTEDVRVLVKAVTWQYRGWQSPDPLKDAQALRTRLALGITSRTSAMADEGTDFEENLDRLEAELEAAEKAGVPISGEDLQGAATPPAADSTDTGAAPADDGSAPVDDGAPEDGSGDGTDEADQSQARRRLRRVG